MSLVERIERIGNLILSRKKGESITIFDPNDGTFQPIKITLYSGRASIGVRAAGRLTVIRSELAEPEAIAR